jgi:acyl carrier protein
LNLIIAIEKRFGIKFATAEISRLKDDDQNIGTLLALIARKRG